MTPTTFDEQQFKNDYRQVFTLYELEVLTEMYRAYVAVFENVHQSQTTIENTRDAINTLVHHTPEITAGLFDTIDMHDEMMRRAINERLALQIENYFKYASNLQFNSLIETRQEITTEQLQLPVIIENMLSQIGRDFRINSLENYLAELRIEYKHKQVLNDLVEGSLMLQFRSKIAIHLHNMVRALNMCFEQHPILEYQDSKVINDILHATTPAASSGVLEKELVTVDMREKNMVSFHFHSWINARTFQDFLFDTANNKL